VQFAGSEPYFMHGTILPFSQNHSLLLEEKAYLALFHLLLFCLRAAVP
jgi:hypothetical protein